MKKKLTIAQKIWLSISILVLGYLFSMVLGFYLGEQIESRLLVVSDLCFPLAQKSEMALTDFKEVVRLLGDAVVFGDQERVVKAGHVTEKTRDTLMAMAQICSQPGGDGCEAIVDTVTRLERYSAEAIEVYGQMSKPKVEDAVLMSLAGKAEALFHQSEVIKAQLEKYTIAFSQDLKNNLAEVRFTSRQQRFTNLFIFIAVVVCSMIFMTIVIARSIMAPLRKTLMLEKVTEQFADGIAVTDLEGKIVFANRAWGEMHGHVPEELIGRQIVCFHTTSQVDDEFLPVFNDACATGLSIGEIGHKHKDGRIFPTLTAISQMYDEKGSVFGMIHSVQDITGQKQNELELKQAKQDAEAANASKSIFLANMSHEIRTPLNGVMGVLNLMLSTELDKEQLDLVQTGKNSADNLLTVISDILDFSKIEAGKLDMEEIEFDLHNTVQEVVKLPAINSHSKGLEFACFIHPDVPSRLIGDPGRLRQIILNLTNNAIKFTSKGEIVVRVGLEDETETDARVRFEVSDTGIGISRDKQATIFEAFQQSDTSTTRVFGGTGLGLSISSKLVEMMNGKIGVQSTPGQGTSFWFTARFAKQPGMVDESDVLPASIAGKRFLIVDDNKTNLDILGGYLSAWGCGYDAAQSGATAIDLMHAVAKVNAPFDAAIIDMLMPGMDGLELGRRIKNDSALKETRMVMLTSLGLRGDAARMKEVGFNAFLNKPVKRAQLFDCLITLFSHQSSNETSKPLQLITQHALQENKYKNIRILIAEDNLINQKIASRMLEKLGFKTAVANNGKEAISMLEQRDYQLVLMDRQMPVMDGFEATRLIRSDESRVRDRQVPIIALTATAMKGDKESCLQVGMNDYVAKPIDPQALLAAIERNLHSSKTSNR